MTNEAVKRLFFVEGLYLPRANAVPRVLRLQAYCRLGACCFAQATLQTVGFNEAQCRSVLPVQKSFCRTCGDAGHTQGTSIFIDVDSAKRRTFFQLHNVIGRVKLLTQDVQSKTQGLTLVIVR